MSPCYPCNDYTNRAREANDDFSQEMRKKSENSMAIYDKILNI